MKIGFYGGTFDPFHSAHRAFLEAALATGALDRIVVMPAGSPPHKRGQIPSFASYRLRMAELVCEDLPQVEVSSWELERAEPSYTLDSLTYLQTLHGPEVELVLLIGQDMLQSFRAWHRFAEILERVTLMVADRPGYSDAAYEQELEHLTSVYGARIERFPMEPLAIAGSDIRQAIRSGELDWEAQLPEAVARFIQQNALYTKDRYLEALSPACLNRLYAYERLQLKLMSTGRLVHVVNVMYEALELALRFGGDPEQAAVAGILHDIVKELPLAEQRKLASSVAYDEAMADAILHGPAATTYLQDELGIHDPDILRAVANHSVLSEEPELLEMLVYLADKIEPGRQYEDLPEIRAAAQRQLEEAVLLTIDGQERNLRGKRHELLPQTLEAKHVIQQRLLQGLSHEAKERN